MIPDWRKFTPATLLRNQHLMTIVPGYWPRRALHADMPAENRLFTTDPRTQLLGVCHWQPNRTASQTLVLVHGLEGSSDSHYMRGIADKAYRIGMNVIRMNQRTCGGTEHLTPTLYNSGLSQDYRAIVHELAVKDKLTRVWLIGYSMGGNLVLKTAGESGSSEPALVGAIAVCPNIDPAQCASALEEPRNWLYHYHFLTKLKARIKRKAVIFPGRWNIRDLDHIRTISEFDNRYTAHDGGYASGSDYYDRAGARHVLHQVTVPTLIITAQDDPFIPYSMFGMPAILNNKQILVLAPKYGGHCGFLQQGQADEDRFWAEHRVMDFIVQRTAEMESAR
ncbi:MAG: alpha/beta fold hydrolase [Nitrospira sp.]|nr:alpha/beta fold hydrolase [Nitrospira sp.]